MSSKRAGHDLMVKVSSDFLKNVRKSSKAPKSPQQLERHLKGVANHRRISVILFLAKHKEATLEQLSSALDCNFKTIAEHTRRLHQAGLIQKKYVGRSVSHTLSPYGKILYEFLRTFSLS
jgi:predicted transcriptional regulator